MNKLAIVDIVTYGELWGCTKDCCAMTLERVLHLE